MNSFIATSITAAYLTGIVWFALAQWISIKFDGEHRVGAPARTLLALFWPVAISTAGLAVLMAKLFGRQGPPRGISGLAASRADDFRISFGLRAAHRSHFAAAPTISVSGPSQAETR